MEQRQRRFDASQVQSHESGASLATEGDFELFICTSVEAFVQESEQELEAGSFVADKADACLRENFDNFMLTKAMTETVLRNRRQQRSAKRLLGAVHDKEREKHINNRHSLQHPLCKAWRAQS